ncbi:MAG: DoxX family protein [Candidatus Woesearchaeota archaeon]|nr:DoxX family protein [Candidatus Woesearchaeota archaeon]
MNKGKNIALWVVQVLLAALFLFAGTMKFIMPIEEMTKQMPLPALFIYFIGVAEILGGLGLVLPMLLRIKPKLTPIAAGGLFIIMAGATVISVMIGGVATAVFPFAVTVLCAVVAYCRW